MLNEEMPQYGGFQNRGLVEEGGKNNLMGKVYRAFTLPEKYARLSV